MEREKEGDKWGGAAFLCRFTVAVTAAAETGVCLYSGHRGQDKSHMVQAGHTWPHSDLPPPVSRPRLHQERPKWCKRPHDYYLCNLIQTLPVHKWASLRDIYERAAYQCQNSQPPPPWVRNLWWAGGVGVSTLMHLWLLVTSPVQRASS